MNLVFYVCQMLFIALYIYFALTNTQARLFLLHYYLHNEKRGIYTCSFVTLAVGSHPNRTNRIDTHAGVYTECTQKVCQ